MHIILLFLLLTSAPHEQHPAGDVHSATQNNQRGTQESPLIVHEDQRPQSKDEAADYQQKQREERQAKKLSNRFNFALVAVGILQAVGLLAQVLLSYGRPNS